MMGAKSFKKDFKTYVSVFNYVNEANTLFFFKASYQACQKSSTNFPSKSNQILTVIPLSAAKYNPANEELSIQNPKSDPKPADFQLYFQSQPAFNFSLNPADL